MDPKYTCIFTLRYMNCHNFSMVRFFLFLIANFECCVIPWWIVIIIQFLKYFLFWWLFCSCYHLHFTFDCNDLLYMRTLATLYSNFVTNLLPYKACFYSVYFTETTWFHETHTKRSWDKSSENFCNLTLYHFFETEMAGGYVVTFVLTLLGIVLYLDDNREGHTGRNQHLHIP